MLWMKVSAKCYINNDFAMLFLVQNVVSLSHVFLPRWEAAEQGSSLLQLHVENTSLS